MLRTRSSLSLPLVALSLSGYLACSSSGSSDGSTGGAASGGASANAGTSTSAAGTAGGGSVVTGAGGAVGTSGSGSAGSAAGTSGAGASNAGGSSIAGSAAGGASGANVGGSASGGRGGAPSAGSGGTSSGGGSCSGPVGTISGALATGVAFMDTEGQRVNAHGGGIIREGDTYYMHGEVFSSTSTANNFVGFSMYSSKDLATWKNEGIILPTQASGELGPNRKGERPHIIKCPSSGEFVLYAHAASEDYQTDKEVVYATSSTVNGQYSYKGALKNASGTLAVHSDMSAYADDSGAYVVTESGHVYTLTADCHGWVSDKTYGAVNGNSGGSESPTIFKAGSTYYWIGSNKTGWRANNNFYSTAPAMSGPWTYQGFLAPVKDESDEISDERTWLSQSTWVQPIVGCSGTTYLYWGDHWDGTQDTSAPGRHNSLATYVFQPLVFDGIKISLPTYKATWKLDVGAGTWSQ
ncbi:MAG TPA: family 43 glycosylhydrolase [Polyangiaceae bacterium]|nr:family 43 glycosylhydrolase [Polyangiaceae bacterium]